jgi:FtsZ-binding cell division protein ZapB
MDQEHEIEERLARIEALRHDVRRLNRESKQLRADKKDAQEQIEVLLDEIKDVREGGSVQLTIAK